MRIVICIIGIICVCVLTIIQVINLLRIDKSTDELIDYYMCREQVLNSLVSYISNNQELLKDEHLKKLVDTAQDITN